MKWFSDILSTLLLIADLLRQLVQAIVFAAYRPQAVRFVVIREFEQMLVGKFLLPVPGAKDVVKRVLAFSVNGESSNSFDLAGDSLESEELKVEDGVTIAGSLVDVDDAGNQSLPREFEFVVVDTIAPPQPGEVGFVVTGEE